MKKKAFTLAEVLITLGIIGVVAALTIPTLVQRNTNETHVQQLKKTYATLMQAAQTALEENNVTNLRETELGNPDGNQGPKTFLNKYFKVAIDCDNKMEPCFAQSYKNINGDVVGFPISDREGCVSLSDGTAICILEAMGKSMYDEWAEIHGWHKWIRVFIDVNGPKGPNINGRDFFYVELYDDGKVGESYVMQKYHIDYRRENCSYTSYGSCFSVIVADGWKMDY